MMSLHLNPDVTTTETEEGTVLLQLSTGRYWQLNTTGSVILRALIDGAEPGEIAGEIAARHHVDAGQVRSDVDAVVGRLRDAKLVIS